MKTNHSFKKLSAALMLFAFVFSTVSPVFASGIGNGGNTAWSDGTNLGSTADFLGHNWTLYNKDANYAYVITTEILSKHRFGPSGSYANTKPSQYSTSELRPIVNNYQTEMEGYSPSVGAAGSAVLSWNDIHAGEYIANHEMLGETALNNGGSTYTTESITTDKLYILSKAEAQEGYFSTNDSRIAYYGSDATTWWLRSPNPSRTNATSGVNSSGVIFTSASDNVPYESGIRPALQINLASPLFKSFSYLFTTAEDGKSSVNVGDGFALPDAAASELTKQTKESLTFTGTASASSETATLHETVDTRVVGAIGGVVDLTNKLVDGTALKVSYSNFDTNEAKDHVAAILADNAGNYVNYAKLSTNSAEDGLVVDISKLDANTNYKLYLFSEKINGTTDDSGNTADAATRLINAGTFNSGTNTTTYKNEGLLAETYANSGLTTNLGNGFNLGFGNAQYDTKVNVGSGGGEVSGGTTIAELNANEDTVVNGFVTAEKATIASGKKITTNGVFVSDKYAAIGYGSVANESNTVSVGSSSLKRRITNVADAVNDYDAVNKKQLDEAISGGGTSNAVEYDDTAKTTVTFGDGTNNTTLTHVKAGDLSSTSTDAVNGSQLNATNIQVAGNAANITTNAGKISTLETTVGGINTNVTNLDTRVGTAEGNITTLNSTVEGINTNVTNLTTTVNGVNTNVTNLTTTVNGIDSNVSNLTTTVNGINTNVTNLDTRVGTAETNITTLNSTVSGIDTNVTNLTTTVNGINTNVTNLTTTVNGVNTNVTNLGTRVDTAETNIITLNSTVSGIDTNVTNLTTTVNGVNTNVTNLQSEVTKIINGGAGSEVKAETITTNTITTETITASGEVKGASLNSTGNLYVGGTSIFTNAATFNSTATFNGGINAGNKAITNVLADTSSDTNAVNYGQFKKAVTEATYTGGVLTLKNAGGETVLSQAISGGSGGDDPNAVHYTDATKTTVTFGDGTNNTTLTHVKAGDITSAESNDAVNGGQLYATNQLVAGNAANITTNAGKISTLETTVGDASSGLVKDVADVKSDVATVKGDVNTLKTDMTNVKSDVTNLGNTVTTLQNNVAAYDGRISTVEGSVSSLQTTVNKITSGSGEIKTQVVETKEFTVKDSSGTQTTVIDESGITTNSVAVGGNTVINESGVTTNNVTTNNVTSSNANVSNSLTVGGKVNITENGIDMGGQQIINIANGVTSATPLSASNKNAINGADLYNETRNGATGNYIAETNTTALNLKKLDDAIGKIDDGIVYKALNPDGNVAENLEALDDAIKNIEVGNVETIAGNKTSSSEKAAKATGANSIAIGYNTEVSGKEAIGAGYGNKVTGDYSTAVGYKNEISGNNSGAFGDPNIVEADASYAYGNDNRIYATSTETNGSSHVIGSNNYVKADNTFVLGNKVGTEDAPVTANNSVILGSGSKIDMSKLSDTDKQNGVISVGAEGAERRIMNVADGINPTDAATVGQLNSVAGQIENAIAPAIQNMQNQLGSVSNEVREVGAISAALAGLHFAEPSGEEGDKLVGAVAYGGYRGANAEAIGLAYKPNPNMMLSASTSISNGNDSQNAYNVGFSLKFGKGETAQTRAELKKQVKFVNEQNIALKDTVAQQGDTIAQQGAEIQTLKNDNEAIRKENAEIKEMLKKLIKK